jgi:thioredoxin reductase (NADPH)
VSEKYMVDMEDALKKMSEMTQKLMKKGNIGSAEDEGYISRDNKKIYDVIIIGAGPAGLAAGIYAGRARLDTLIIEKEKDGGQIVITAEIENYPGGIEGESGSSLIRRMSKQAAEFGAHKVYDTIVEVELEGAIKKVIGNKGEYYGKTVILATGAYPRPIGCPGERELVGKGVSYCATCDGAFFTDMNVYVVGGGDAAMEEAIYLTKFAKKVTIIHRRDKLRAAKSIQEKAFANQKIAFMWDTVITELKGDGLLESMVVKNLKTDEITEIFAPEDDGTFGVFVFIGFIPQTSLFEGKVEMDHGYILTDDDMRTNIPGVFAAGDARKKSLRQVVTAVADGAVAAVQANRFIEGL